MKCPIKCQYTLSNFGIKAQRFNRSSGYGAKRIERVFHVEPMQFDKQLLDRFVDRPLISHCYRVVILHRQKELDLCGSHVT
jgi:hypothetical protein